MTQAAVDESPRVQAARRGWATRRRRVAETAAFQAARERQEAELRLRQRAAKIERMMRKIVQSVVGKHPPDGFDPLTLLTHARVGKKLERLGREWVGIRNDIWARIEA